MKPYGFSERLPAWCGLAGRSKLMVLERNLCFNSNPTLCRRHCLDFLTWIIFCAFFRWASKPRQQQVMAIFRLSMDILFVEGILSNQIYLIITLSFSSLACLLLVRFLLQCMANQLKKFWNTPKAFDLAEQSLERVIMLHDRRIDRF